MNIFFTLFYILLLIPLKGYSQSINHQLFSEILSDYVRSGWVDYKRLKSDKRLDTYISKLEKTNVTYLNKDEQLAFWINAYNAYTLKLIVDKYPVKSIRDIGFPLISSPWDKKIASIEGKSLTLNDIEHEIIRKQFDEPRIHFALVCAAKSCPPLRSDAYTGNLLEKQLTDQTHLFFVNSTFNYIDRKQKKIFLSKILEWYQGDFEKKSSFIKTIFPYFQLPEDAISELQTFKIEFLDYNWSLNGN